MNLRNALYFTAGLGFLALAKAKHASRGYTTPKPFDLADVDRCVAYDIQVVDGWLRGLGEYTGVPPGTFLANKSVLELGPGSDLGVGLTLLARGAARYSACDVHDLARRAPGSFYAALFARLQELYHADGALLQRELQALLAGKPAMLNYTVQRNFDLPAAVGDEAIDLVVSQAAFEHFENIDGVVAQITRVCRAGAMIVAEIDLKTHSRWIRDRDPNNIYRYPDALYQAFHFRGSPNRVRPHEYAAAFARHGWSNIRITPLTTVAAQNGANRLSRRFSAPVNQMDYLTILLCATKATRQ